MTQCTANNDGVVCGQWWFIGGWVGVIDSLRVGLRHGVRACELSKKWFARSTLLSE